MNRMGTFQPTGKYKNYSLSTTKPFSSHAFYQEKVRTPQEMIYGKLKKIGELLESLYPKLTDHFSGNAKIVIERNLKILMGDLDLMQKGLRNDPHAFDTSKLKINQHCISEMRNICDTLQTVKTYEHEFRKLGQIRHFLHELEHLIQPTHFEKSLQCALMKIKPSKITKPKRKVSMKAKKTLAVKPKAKLSVKKVVKKVTKPKAKVAVKAKKTSAAKSKAKSSVKRVAKPKLKAVAKPRAKSSIKKVVKRVGVKSKVAKKVVAKIKKAPARTRAKVTLKRAAKSVARPRAKVAAKSRKKSVATHK